MVYVLLWGWKMSYVFVRFWKLLLMFREGKEYEELWCVGMKMILVVIWWWKRWRWLCCREDDEEKWRWFWWVEWRRRKSEGGWKKLQVKKNAVCGIFWRSWKNIIHWDEKTSRVWKKNKISLGHCLDLSLWEKTFFLTCGCELATWPFMNGEGEHIFLDFLILASAKN